MLLDLAIDDQERERAEQPLIYLMKSGCANTPTNRHRFYPSIGLRQICLNYRSMAVSIYLTTLNLPIILLVDADKADALTIKRTFKKSNFINFL